MSAPGALFLTLSAATPASSLFVIVPDVISQSGSGALLAMLLAGGLALCMAWVYAELSQAYPIAGGEYAIVGRILGPTAGFAVLGMNLLNSIFAAAVLALGLGDYLPLTEGLGGAPARAPVAAAALVLSAGLAVLRIRTNARVTGAFLLLEIAALGLLALLGALTPERGVQSLLLHPVVPTGGALAPAPLGAIVLAATVALFAYDGYGSAVYFGEEIRRARRRIGGVILIAVAAILVTEILPLASVLVAAPDLRGTLVSRSPFLDFAAARAGRGVALGLSLAVALALFNAVLALVLLTARQLYAMGRDGVFPEAVNRAFRTLDPKFGSPALAALAAGGAGALLCFVDLKRLLMITGAGVAGVYLALAIALLAWRRQRPGRQGSRAGRLLAALASAGLLGVLGADLADPAEGRPGLIATALSAALGAAWWRLYLKRRGGFAFTGPRDDAAEAARGA